MPGPGIGLDHAAHSANAGVPHTVEESLTASCSVVLRTEFTSNDVSLNELKNVVDPLNWKTGLPFFCDMRPLPTPARTDGWSRVLEVCNTTCPYPPDMRTPLKFWTGPVAAEASMLSVPMAWVNYELDDTPANPYPGDGLVLVDEGFIKMHAPTSIRRPGSSRRNEEGCLLPLPLGGRHRNSCLRLRVRKPGRGHAARRRSEVKGSNYDRGLHALGSVRRRPLRELYDGKPHLAHRRFSIPADPNRTKSPRDPPRGRNGDRLYRRILHQEHHLASKMASGTMPYPK